MAAAYSVIFIVIFPLFWCAVSYLISRIGGWHALAQKYAHTDMPAGGPALAMCGVRLRREWFWGGNYNGVVTLHVDKDALYLSMMFLFRVGHPSLRIPFADMSIEKDKGTFSKCAYVTFKTIPHWTLILSMKNIEWIEHSYAQCNDAP